MGDIISVHNVSYNYVKNKNAVDNLSFSIPKGSIAALIGVNGGGKSTTIKLLTGILKPSNGIIHCVEGDPFKNRKRISRKIGIIFGNKTQLIWEISAKEYFQLHKRIYNISDEIYHRNMDYFDSVLGIYSFYEQQVRTMSLGQRIRCDIVAGFLHNPEIVFMDEPTIGLDIFAKKNIRKAIKEINRQLHTSIIITSHDLEDIEDICDKILLIDKGKLFYNGDIGAFKQIVDFDECLHFHIDEDDNYDIKVLEKQYSNKWEITSDRELIIYYNSKCDNKMEILKFVLEHQKVKNVEIKKIRIDFVLEKILK